MIITIIWIASISQALMDYGENARYSIAFQPLITYAVLLFAFFDMKQLKETRLFGGERKCDPTG
ncbi:MAG: hypothetical protein AB1757_26370 [Acidobacteriota bacterium]